MCLSENERHIAMATSGREGHFGTMCQMTTHPSRQEALAATCLLIAQRANATRDSARRIAPNTRRFEMSGGKDLSLYRVRVVLVVMRGNGARPPLMVCGLPVRLAGCCEIELNAGEKHAAKCSCRGVVIVNGRCVNDPNKNGDELWLDFIFSFYDNYKHHCDQMNSWFYFKTIVYEI